MYITIKMEIGIAPVCSKKNAGEVLIQTIFQIFIKYISNKY